MKCVAYIRVSSESQVEKGDSLDGQKYHIDKWCKEQGYEIVNYYEDAGYSAYSGKRRPSFEDMLQFIQSENQHKKVIDAVVVYNLSRLTRRVEEQVRLIGIFKRFDVELKSIADNLIDWDSTTTLLFNILGSVNEHQSALNGKTVTDRLYDTARKGFFTGGTVPFGYKSINAGKTNDKQRKKLVVDDSEAEYVKQIFHWAKGDISNQPMGVKKIANKLNELKITNRMKLWNKNAIGKLLNNPIYIGQYIYGKTSKYEEKEPIVVPVPPIIDEELFNTVKKGLRQRELKNRELAAWNTKYLLSGILKCPKCGSKLVMMTGKSGSYKYYDCGKKIRKGKSLCSFKPIPKDKIECIVLDKIFAEVFTPKNIMGISKDLRKRYSECFAKDANELTRLTRKLKIEEDKLHRFIQKFYNEPTEVQFSSVSDFIKKQEKEVLEVKKAVMKLSKNSKELPIMKFGEVQAQLFCTKLSKCLRESTDSNANWLLKSLITDIKVEWNEKKKLRIRGKKIVLLNCVSKTKTGTDFSVPVSVSRWWRDRDLNPRNAINGCRFSRPVLSTTQPSLQQIVINRLLHC